MLLNLIWYFPGYHLFDFLHLNFSIKLPCRTRSRPTMSPMSFLISHGRLLYFTNPCSTNFPRPFCPPWYSSIMMRWAHEKRNSLFCHRTLHWEWHTQTFHSHSAARCSFLKHDQRIVTSFTAVLTWPAVIREWLVSLLIKSIVFGVHQRRGVGTTYSLVVTRADF